MERRRPSNDEYNRPMNRGGGGDLPPLPFLPEREWLYGRIVKVEYDYAYFRGKIQYLTKKDTDEVITDPETGDPIPRREFSIEIHMREHTLPNGEPRRAWVRFGASMNKKAHLAQFLTKMGMHLEDDTDVTPADICDFLREKGVRFQMATKNGENGKYQQMVWDSVEPSEE